MKLTDPRFVYTPACATDIRVTFDRARAEIERNKNGRVATAAAGAGKARKLVLATQQNRHGG